MQEREAATVPTKATEREITLTDAEIEALPDYARELAKLHAAGTEAPWAYQDEADAYTHIVRGPEKKYLFAGPQSWSESVKTDMKLAAESRNAVPRLLRDLAEARRELFHLRHRVFALRRASGCDHTTACTIWGDNGQGGTAEGFKEPLPCTCGALENFYKRERDEARRALRKANACKWRPIEEMHESHGPCNVMRLDDPGYIEVWSILDTDWPESLANVGWTHFAPVASMTIQDAERLRDAAAKVAEE